MNVPALTLVICIGVTATASAQHTPSGGPASPGASSKASLSEIRVLVHELQGRTEKLRDLNEQYRSLVDQRPADAERLAKWQAALERLMSRLDAARAAVVETMQALNQSATGQLPTGVGKELANARNEAEAQRVAAEQALAKSKAAPAHPSKRGKQAPATPKTAPPPIPDDL